MTAVTRTDAGAARADAEARLSELYAEYAPALSRFLSGFTNGSPYGADDLLQETMMRVWRRLGDVPAEPDSTRRWLFTVARNVGIDAVRRARSRPVCVELSDGVSAASVDNTLETVVARDSLRTAFGALSDTHRDVLVELHLEGKSAAEVAHRLRVPEGTVKSRAFYALQSLRLAIGQTAQPSRRPSPRVRHATRPVAGSPSLEAA
ncbi:sigma-70 family RNA polymerase sigma factor [Micromonospora sp. CPCC 205539]|uniref:sigma-70 family RNA polymerase sigma factor n=1 Tax=Micromonospora sp. CPCC 205539 TaxID=3122408 RepID=UPI002FF0A47A